MLSPKEGWYKAGVDRLLWKKNGTDTLYQSLLELMTRPLGDVLYRLWTQGTMELNSGGWYGGNSSPHSALYSCLKLSAARTQTVKTSFNARGNSKSDTACSMSKWNSASLLLSRTWQIMPCMYLLFFPQIVVALVEEVLRFCFLCCFSWDAAGLTCPAPSTTENI